MNRLINFTFLASLAVAANASAMDSSYEMNTGSEDDRRIAAQARAVLEPVKEEQVRVQVKQEMVPVKDEPLSADVQEDEAIVESKPAQRLVLKLKLPVALVNRELKRQRDEDERRVIEEFHHKKRVQEITRHVLEQPPLSDLEFLRLAAPVRFRAWEERTKNGAFLEERRLRQEDARRSLPVHNAALLRERILRQQEEKRKAQREALESRRQAKAQAEQRKIQLEMQQFQQEQALRQQWNAAQDDETITLQSNDGRDFLLRVRVAKQAGTIKSLMEDVGVSDTVPLLGIDAKTLETIVALLLELDYLKWQTVQNSSLYVPRAFQPIINSHLQKPQKFETIQAAKKILDAANYLDIPEILKGTVFVIFKQMNARYLKNFKKDLDKLFSEPRDAAARQEREATLLRLKIYGLDEIHKFKKDLRAFMGAYSDAGITEEYSIADHIKRYGQPHLTRNERGRLGLSFAHQKLTSLFGLHLLELRDRIRFIELSGNCFFERTQEEQRIAHYLPDDVVIRW